MEELTFPDLTVLNSALPGGIEVAKRGEKREETLVELLPTLSDAERVQRRWPGAEFEKSVLEQRRGETLDWSTVEKKLDNQNLAWRHGGRAVRYAFQLGQKRNIVLDQMILAVGISNYAAVVFMNDGAGKGTFYSCRIEKLSISKKPIWQRLPLNLSAFKLGTVADTRLAYLDGDNLVIYDLAAKTERSCTNVPDAKRVFSIKASRDGRMVALLTSNSCLLFSGSESTSFGSEAGYRSVSLDNSSVLLGTVDGEVEVWVPQEKDYGLYKVFNYFSDAKSTVSGEELKLSQARPVQCLEHRGDQRLFIATDRDAVSMHTASGKLVMPGMGNIAAAQYYGDLLAVLQTDGLVGLLEPSTCNVLVKTEKYTTVPCGSSLLTYRGDAVFALLPDGTLSGLYAKLKV